jgi:DNA-binding transcriptional LysR family regulator
MAESLDRLKVLAVLLQVKSPSRAAVQLGITQSAVSKALARLRMEFQDEILVRRGGAMMRTAFGEEIAERLLRAVHDLENATNSEGGTRAPRVIRIAARDQFIPSIGSRLVKSVCLSARPEPVEFVTYERSTIAKSLEIGEVDLAIAVDPPNTPGLMVRVLFKSSFVFLTRKRKQPDLKEYLASPQVATSAHPGYSGIDDFLSSKSLKRNIVVTVPYFLSAVEMAKDHGLGVTLPKRLVQSIDCGELRAYSVPVAIPEFAVHLVWDERFTNDAWHTRLRTQIIDDAKHFAER